MTADVFVRLITELYGDELWPKPMHLLQGARAIRLGVDPLEAAKRFHSSRRRLLEVAASQDAVREALGFSPAQLREPHLKKSLRILGQLLLGLCAERAFEEIYSSEMRAQELELRDLRESRTDTDYRLYNGQARPLYRINIKFHGARFRRAPELVGLDPLDCFALATYKIHRALLKQDQERLPYIFAVVGVPDLSGELVGEALPKRLVEASAVIQQAPRAQNKREFEDRLVSFAADRALPVFRQTYAKIRQAPWYLLSARKAYRLLREHLFERVYALRIRGFAQQFRLAELDMHFSLRNDLVGLQEFFETLRKEGLTKVATLLERGEY